MNYAYVRVSKDKQNEARQIYSMQQTGIPPECTYTDKQSGKDFDRPEYKRLVAVLKSGDVLYIHSIDRLGRNYLEVQSQWRHLTHELGVDIVVLDMPILDTRRGKDLIGTLISDIVLQLLGYVAQTEREHISRRTKEGLARKRAEGIRLGRPPGALGKNPKLAGKEAVIQCLLDEGASYAEIARLLHVDRSTLVRFCRPRAIKRPIDRMAFPPSPLPMQSMIP